VRNISFFMTTQQIRDRSKTVTRRLGWAFLDGARAGVQLQPIVKGQGIKPGGHVERIGGPIVVVSARREPLRRMLDEPEYGQAECVAEGYPDLTPEQFVAKFIAGNAKRCTADTVVTRLEFTYLEDQ
jgi:hypothetical protein